METETMSNTELGPLLGLSHVQVSRIRGGSRYPGILTMKRFESVLGWNAADQLKVHGTPAYAEAFEVAISRYASSRKTEEGPGNESPTPSTAD